MFWFHTDVLAVTSKCRKGPRRDLKMLLSAVVGKADQGPRRDLKIHAVTSKCGGVEQWLNRSTLLTSFEEHTAPCIRVTMEEQGDAKITDLCRRYFRTAFAL